MDGATRKAKAAGILQVTALGLLLGAGGCSSLSDFGGEDITKAASTGIGALVGAKPPEQRNAEIELRTRSPLVLPPDYNLRPPVNPVEEEEQLGSNWPEDPDVKAKETAALEAARQAAEYERIKKLPQGRSTPLTPEELAAGTLPPGQQPEGPTGRLARVEPSHAMSPEELLQRHRAHQQAEQQAQQTGSLPQPVVVAKNQTNTTDKAKEGVQSQTQEVVEEKAPPPPAKKKSFLDRLVFWK
jgi:hypothetical protein